MNIIAISVPITETTLVQAEKCQFPWPSAKEVIVQGNEGIDRGQHNTSHT